MFCLSQCSRNRKSAKSVIRMVFKSLETFLNRFNFPTLMVVFKVGKLKRRKKVSSDLKTILLTDLADLRFCGFLRLEKGETCQSILILLSGKIT